MARISDTGRGPSAMIEVDAVPIPFHNGETIAAAMLAAGHIAFRHDRNDRPRGLWCNMGTCCECLILLEDDAGARRVRACLVDAQVGQRITTVSGVCHD